MLFLKISKWQIRSLETKNTNVKKEKTRKDVVNVTIIRKEIYNKIK